MAGIMCEYFSIFCHSIMPPPVHCPNLKGVKNMKARISRKFFGSVKNVGVEDTPRISEPLSFFEKMLFSSAPTGVSHR